MGVVAIVEFTDYAESVARAMDEAGAAEILAGVEKVLLKPNLVLAQLFPVTTHPDFCAAVAGWVRANSRAGIVIGEGPGDGSRSSREVFEDLGYADLARRLDLELVDLNSAPLREVPVPGGRVFTEMHLPEMVFTHFVISLPVLKAHSLAGITGAIKNMMGACPPEHYRSGAWKKSRFHLKMHASIADLAACAAPDFSVMDASVGLCEYHLGGAACDPPVGKILAGADPFAVDRIAAGFLGLDWREIEYLRSGRRKALEREK